VLRIDNNAQMVRVSWTLAAMFRGRYAVQSGRRVFTVRWKKLDFQTLSAAQAERPVHMFQMDRKALWYFHDRFYWDDDGLDQEDIQALILQRERRQQQKLQSARSLMYAEQNGRTTRIAISSEIRRAVFERDGGRCVECESNFDLQYDHVLPVALGGATTIENLQLLCADCNRRKSDSL
jgi:hypothetical protein